eukprot:TRINITY_DN296_c0_g1_i1.p1 TRINITY_DN296_c0_g1~~TRINITY_DN296_c0_g1_i1.p1  ORF type:complete len:259 (-),score=65.45 TRINITY_DN296_c0_g1_i1:118-894(-)
MAYTNKHTGTAGKDDHRVYFLQEGKAVSPFHDIPLWADKEKGIVNMILEIPRGTNAKLEISRVDLLNPIKQDIKDGKLRFVFDKFPYNYGAIPQTWEDPSITHPDTNAKGDNDPLDAVEIGTQTGTLGEVKQVKVLGAWGMIDAGETDWKLLVLDVNDPLAKDVNDIDDVKAKFPGIIEQSYTFLRDYKIPDGKPANQFAYNGELRNKAFALAIVEETHHQWVALQAGTVTGKIETSNLSLKNKTSVTHDHVNTKLGW